MGEMMKCRYCREEHDESAFWGRKGSCPSCGMREMSIAMECRMEEENGEDSTARLEMARKDPSALEKAVERLRMMEAACHRTFLIDKRINPVPLKVSPHLGYAYIPDERVADQKSPLHDWGDPADREVFSRTIRTMGMCSDHDTVFTGKRFWRMVEEKKGTWSNRYKEFSCNGFDWFSEKDKKHDD